MSAEVRSTYGSDASMNDSNTGIGVPRSSRITTSSTASINSSTAITAEAAMEADPRVGD